MSIIYNLNKDGNSLQVSNLQFVPAEGLEIRPGMNPVLIKNLSEEDIWLEVKLPRSSEFIRTVFYPGWNPELIVAIKEVPEEVLQVLQYGN